MRTEIKLRIKQPFARELKEGYPLVAKEALVNSGVLNEEGAIINLYDEKNNFIAKGYYGRQNKGCGWVLSRNEKDIINDSFFEQKIKFALQQRKKFFTNDETTAFRVFNGEGDGIGGLTIDYFDGYYVISWYSLGIYNFKDEIISSLQKAARIKGIYQKKRFDEQEKMGEQDDFVCGEQPEFPLIIKENGVNFAVYLNDGAMVGVFLDQREVRKLIRDCYAKDKTVLNTFSYTGAFSVFAALGNAIKTTSVDLANRSLSKTAEQFSLNSIDIEKQDIIVEDVFNYFKYAVRKELKFDMVILDPPSFARSKKFTFSASKDYKNLLKEALAITAKDGVIVASTNCSTFNMDKFKSYIHMAFNEMHQRYELLQEFSLPEDFKTIKAFKEGNYLKVVFIKKCDS